MEELRSLARNDVFILGAGFSKAVAANFPLAADLLEPIRSRLHDRLGMQVQPRGGEGFEQWLSRLAEDQPYLPPDTNLERAAAFQRVSKEVGKILTDHENAALGNSEPEWLAKLIATWHIRQATVISFNYDNLVEAATLTQQSWLLVATHDILRQLPPLPPRLMREEDPPSIVKNLGRVSYVTNLPAQVAPAQTFRLLKLHGSISWYWDDGDNGGATLQRWPYIGQFLKPVGDQAEDIARQFPGRVPFIAPPSATKSKYLENRVLRDFWREALYALQNAENIYFLGYSVPPQDQAAMGLIIEGVGDRKPQIHILDINADTVRGNLANLLVNYKSLPGESKEAIREKKMEELECCYGLKFHPGGDNPIKNFADSYVDELANELVSNLTDYARSLPAIDQVIEVDCTDSSFKTNPVVGGILAMDGRNPKAMEFDGITVENGILTIPCRIGNLPDDNLALTKLLKHLQQEEVRKIVLRLPRQNTADAQILVPIVDYRLKTNTQPELHPCWHSLHLTPFVVRAPEDQPHYAGMENID